MVSIVSVLVVGVEFGRDIIVVVVVGFNL